MSYEIRVGDALRELRAMDGESVQTCITSPPYFGLRDYGNDAQIGLEPTPDEYVAKLVEVFGEVKRVLRDDGTLWLNLGDAYATAGGHRSTSGSGLVGTPQHLRGAVQGTRRAVGHKTKDLLGMPWMVAFALRADGWYLRSEIIWHKPNPMPASVADRVTVAHETIFLLAKSERYYYDTGAIREGGVYDGAPKPGRSHLVTQNGGVESRRLGESAPTAGRNKRSVWTIAARPYPEAHFAAYPPKLVEPMVLAGCPRDGVVLDPFAGSGTTLQVAVAHGRSAIGIELNPEYAKLARRRLSGITSSMFDLEPAA